MIFLLVLAYQEFQPALLKMDLFALKIKYVLEHLLPLPTRQNAARSNVRHLHGIYVQIAETDYLICAIELSATAFRKNVILFQQL